MLCTRRLFLIGLLVVNGCHGQTQEVSRGPAVPPRPIIKPLPENSSPQLKQMLEGAIAQAGVTTGYDPAYVALDYPGGDVPEKTGVCSDVVVRAFRKAGIDLQKEVHEDLKSARSEYPTRWGAIGPDRNIDHRRVLNLMTYFKRRGKSLPIGNSATNYQPGDIVAWELTGGIDHIGIVTNMLSDSEDRYLIIHNIGPAHVSKTCCSRGPSRGTIGSFDCSFGFSGDLVKKCSSNFNQTLRPQIFISQFFRTASGLFLPSDSNLPPCFEFSR